MRRGPSGPTGAAATEGAARRRVGDAREEFLLALLLQYPDLRPEGLDMAEELLWESENRQVLAALRQSASGGAVEGIEGVKEALPAELRPHLERLIERRLPSFDPKGAREALATCRRGLELRRLKAEKQATAALLAAWEEEVGASALAEAAVSAAERNGRMKEVVSLHMKDMETGLRLHGKERSDDPDHIGETRIDG